MRLWFNNYERHARAAPGLLALLPIAIVATAVGLQANPIVSAIVGLVIAAGGPLVLADLVRTRGLAIQDQMYDKWDGKPTTTLLLLSNESENPTLRDRRRADLERVAGITLLDRDAEAQDPRTAANTVDAGVANLRNKTRDQRRFELLFAENKSYGFHRNMLAIRSIGVWTSAACSVAALVLSVLATADVVEVGTLPSIVALVVCIVLLAVWIGFPSEQRVRDAATKYAETLLDSGAAL